MSKQVELALLSLMPTYGKDLPPQLIELAGSLLAQSRDRASALKQEEEIARHYACANIACDRLKISLDLPTVVPRPPIPPRIYKRLYTHLDNILPNPSSSRRASSRVRTPVAKFSIEESPARPLPSRGTPSKDQSLAQFRSTNTPSTRHKTSARFESAPSKSGLRPWIAPVARFFCHETDNKRLAPTILAGMDHVTRQAVQTEDAWVREHTTKALVSIYFFVMMRVKALSSAEIDGKQSYVALRKEIVELLCRARNDVTFTGAEDDGAWDGYTILTLKDFDDAIAYAKEQTWFESDWFEGIAGVVKSDTDTRMADAETFDGADEPVRRADTMFQDKFDFLSESRRSDFKIWKERQLTRIMELSVTNGAMEVDSH